MEAKTITILNRLNRKDSNTGMDVWYSHKIHNVQYSIQEVTTVVGTTVSMGQSYVILIPFTDLYAPYTKWKDMIDKDSYFTMNQGDYIILDDIDDIITPNNVQQIRQQYATKSCEVRTIIEVPRKLTTNIQLKVSGI